ncbi:Uncharacterised protein [Vibrio cholerae]|nr:Uncharacterised protein [Vibrio cholerae]
MRSSMRKLSGMVGASSQSASDKCRYAISRACNCFDASKIVGTMSGQSMSLKVINGAKRTPTRLAPIA